MMGNKTKAYIAYLIICIAWGTTYLAIRVGVLHYPAFLFAGIRQVVSGILMLIIGIVWYKKVDLSKKTFKHNILIGFLLITIGNGTVSWAEKFIPSGVAALICTMMPLNAVIINLITSKDEKLSLTIVLGMLLAFGGVVLIFKDNIADLANPAYLFGMISIYFATAFWAFGSILNRKKVDIINPIFNSGVQIGMGGLFLVLLSPIVDSYVDFEPFQPDALLSMGYLVIVGSIIAYTAYMYALKKLPVGFVTSYAYINPLVAVLLGYVILGEKLTWYTWLAFAGIVSGVYLVNRGYKKTEKT